jgi:DNA-binding beta-propeller fold protein YncE
MFSLVSTHLAYGQELLHITKWGSYGDGNRSFKFPSSVAVDSTGNVYVADRGNDRIQMFSGFGQFILNWGTYGSDNGSFKSPSSVAVDSTGNLYVADTGNNRIQIFSSGNGTFITKWGTYGNDNGSFKSPSSAAVDSTGNVYVADTGNNRIQMFSANGTFITNWGTHGDDNGTFKSPSSVAVDSKGNVYVADTENNRIQLFSANGTFITKWGTYGVVNGTFKSPSSVAVDSKGNVYVADTGNDRIQMFSANGTFITNWGTRGDDIGDFKSPSSVAVDSKGNVYVADTGNNRIQMFSANGNLLTKWGTRGDDNGSFKSPSSAAVDSTGNVYVADTGNNRIQMFTANGTFITKWGTNGTDNGSFKSPSSAAVDSTGNVYVADTGNDRIQMFTANGNFITKWGTYGMDNGSFKSPSSVAVDSTGNVYVADTDNNRIQMFTANGTFITKWGTNGTDNGDLNQPNGIATIPNSDNKFNKVIVADTGNNRIQMFTANGTFITKLATYGTDNGTFKSPSSVAVDSTGNVYVADTGNNRVVVLNLEYLKNINLSNEDGNIIIDDPNLKIKTIFKDLNLPTSLAFLGPNDILVSEQYGTVKRIVDGKLLREPLLNLTEYKIRSCMCDIAVAKQNLTTYIFLIIDELEDHSGNLFDRLYRYELANNSELVKPTILLNIPIKDEKSYHHGGKIKVGPDNNLYVTIGDIDGYNTKAQNIQNGSDPDGSSSILRITLDGKPVEGSTIFDNLDPLNKYYAYGIRNSFGIDFDPITGKIWITDNGDAHDDEINLVEPGFNGGWKKLMGLASLNKGFNSTELVDFNKKGIYTDPQFVWFNAIGPTALKFFNSTKLGQKYHNGMFVGDVNTGNLYMFRLNDTRTGLSLNGSLSDKVANTVQEREQSVFAKGFGLITDIQVGPDSFLYIVSMSQGKIYAVTPSK